MKICLFAASFLPKRGGMEFVIHHLGNALVDMGHSVTVMAHRQKQSKPFDHNYRLLLYGYTFRGAEKLGANMLSAYSALKNENLCNPFDVVHCHSVSYAGMRTVFAKKLLGFPLVMTPHGEDIQRVPEINYGKRLNPFWNFVIRKNLLNADAVTSISDSVKNEMDFIPDEKIFDVPNGTHVSDFSSAESTFLHEKLSISTNKKVILSVGRNHIKKGYEYGIRAFKLFNEQINNENMVYVIVGKDTDKLDPLVKGLGLKENIYLLPRTSREDVLKFYQSAWCFFSPSLMEGLSMVSLEAMGAGLPLILTDVPGNVDILKNNECGIVVKNKDVHSMANALFQLYSNKDQYAKLADKSKSQIANYDWSKIAQKYLYVYERAISSCNDSMNSM